MKGNTKKPSVAVVAIVRKEGKVLVGKRKGSHGAGTWGFPGGHLEFGETIDRCAKREVFEETGIRIKNLIHGPHTEDYLGKNGFHFVTIFVVCDFKSGMLKDKEPKREVGWKWVSWNKLPKPYFSPVKNILKQKFNPFP